MTCEDIYHLCTWGFANPRSVRERGRLFICRFLDWPVVRRVQKTWNEVGQVGGKTFWVWGETNIEEAGREENDVLGKGCH